MLTFVHDYGEISVHISTISKKQGLALVEYVKISVVNFGYVIPEGQIDLIFDQFYQLDNDKKSLGSGIGLSLIKRLTELHKGEIFVSSSAVGGTDFSVLLRLGNGHLSENECVAEAEASDEQTFYIDRDPAVVRQQIEEPEVPMSIAGYNDELQSLLIVEDNLDLQHFIKQIFVHKYNVFVAENGEQAIEIANQNVIDLIISDVHMPVMDGFELCHHEQVFLPEKRAGK